MTGADIVGSLLRADAALIGVAADSIKLGALPDGVTLPALLIRVVSSVERQPLKRRPTIRRTDRIAVTVRAGNYRDQTAIIGKVRNLCTGRTGAIGGGSSVSILNAGTGPDVAGPASSFEQTQDFRVSFDATT